MAENPRFVIHADDHASIVQGRVRYEIQGAQAAEIIAAYRHYQSHPDTGETEAQLYLWGVIDSIRYEVMSDARRRLDDVRKRRLDRAADW
jgi:hypothetical protein